ncbi:MAG: hypothetical protein L6Q97_20600 [Thermoanaerobaculia bacterium]|nr:hypothetical protein [Thermoanaerobaculia bacterium]
MLRHLILPAFICLFSCSLHEKDVAGEWRAVAFFENGRSLATNLDSVSLRLSPEGGYEFRSQGFYRESGSYRVSVRYLFMTDTTQTPVKEHIVKVLYLSSDTLKIRMSYDNKEQVLFLARRQMSDE